MFALFTETDAWIEHDALVRDSSGIGPLQPSFKKLTDLRYHVLILRRLLHGLWHALHVHEDNAASMFPGHEEHVRLAGQGRDIIDNSCPGFETATGHLGLGCIH